MFVRKFLSPNAKDDRTLASLDEVDSLLSAFKTDVATEEEYWKACEALFRGKATGMTFAEMNYPDQPEMVITRRPSRGWHRISCGCTTSCWTARKTSRCWSA